MQIFRWPWAQSRKYGQHLGRRAGVLGCVALLLSCLIPPAAALAAPPCAAGTAGAACQDGMVGLAGPSVAYIEPTQGVAGTTVAVWGGGFTTAQAVYFGPNAGSHLTVLSDTELLVAAPAGSGTVAVTVRSAYGASIAVPKAQFTYTAPATPPALPPVTTPHGSFSLALPAGTPSAPTVSASCTAPANLPADLKAVSCLYDLSGPALTPPGVLTLHYDPANLGGLSPSRLSVYALTGPSGWRPVASTVYASQDAVVAGASGPEVLVLLADQQRFSDLAGAAWAQAAVDSLSAAGIVSGFPDGSFRPALPLTRAEFVKMLVLATGLAPGSGITPFTDVPVSAWFAPYVSTALQAHLVQGLSASTFGPNAPLTREQMAVLLTRALGLTGSAPVRFTDVGQIDAWALPGVQAAVAAGYLAGFPDGSFRPQAVATRAEAAVVLDALWTRRS